MVWYKEFGFHENPFDLRPNTSLVGLEAEQDQLMNHIMKEEICFLNGLTGSGKTSLLRKTQVDMPDHSFIYLDAQDLPLNFNLEEAIKNRRSFFDRITFRETPRKTPVLIIDEFQETDKNLVLEARGKWENDKRIKSIIICQIRKNLRNVTPAFKERLGNRMVTLRTLDDDEMKEVLKVRLAKGDKNLYDKFDIGALDLLVDCADGNPRRLLEYTDLIFDFHYRKFDKINPLTKKGYKITYWGTKEILQLNNINVEAHEDKRLKEHSTAEKVEDIFDEEHQRVVKFFMTGAKTVEDLADYFQVHRNRANKLVKELKEKKALVSAGKRDRKKLWQTAPHIKRLTVNE